LIVVARINLRSVSPAGEQSVRAARSPDPVVSLVKEVPRQSPAGRGW